MVTAFKRPTTEMHIRPIPGENGKYVAIAGVHHNVLPGVLVYINTNIPDDDKWLAIADHCRGRLLS